MKPETQKHLEQVEEFAEEIEQKLRLMLYQAQQAAESEAAPDALDHDAVVWEAHEEPSSFTAEYRGWTIETRWNGRTWQYDRTKGKRRSYECRATLKETRKLALKYIDIEERRLTQ